METADFGPVDYFRMNVETDDAMTRGLAICEFIIYP